MRNHALQAFDEEPLSAASRTSRRGAAPSPRFPTTSSTRGASVPGDVAAVQGHTTGSHLALPDEEEFAQSLIRLAAIADGAVRRWRLVEDTAALRREHGLA